MRAITTRKLLGLAIATMVLVPACTILTPMRAVLNWEWTRPGATAEELSAAEYACMQEWDGIPLYELCMEANGWKRN